MEPKRLLTKQVAGDLLPVIVLIVLGLIPDPEPQANSSTLAALLIPLPLLLRRRWPVQVFGVLAVVSSARLFAGENSVTDLSVLVALYSIASNRSARATAVATSAAEIGMIAAVVQYANEDLLGPLIGASGLVLASAALGAHEKGRRELVASLNERAARLEIERDQERVLAAAAERARVSREMHDIVAHNLAVMVSQADGAANVVHRDPDRAERAARDIAATGRRALLEMRRLLGLLREGATEDRSPQPGLERIDEMIENVRAAGMPVDVRRIDGPDFTPSPGLQLATYRIVQESLTNALKHGGPNAEAVVDITWNGPRVTLEVANTGVVNGSDGVGAGLTGMRERVAAFGGTLDVGADGHGGWTVKAILSDEAVGASQ